MTIEINLFEALLPDGPTIVFLLILLWIVADTRRAARGTRTDGDRHHVD